MSILPLDTTVEFYSTGGVADPFVLDSAESGVLGEDVLEGVLPVDITADVIQIAVRRGKSRWLDDIQAGTASITLNNQTTTRHTPAPTRKTSFQENESG